ncbi:MAG: response regulator [Candidatus Schekmanbacteria bacterium]|nr:response regulator [Candidatus Schekmanbacteria bacterium]
MARPELGPANLLVIDDEPGIRELLSRHFAFLGYRVDTAANGKEALDCLSRRRYDVTISDIKMPVMTGVELLRVVGRDYPMMSTIMITGYVDMTNLLDCMRYGAHTVVYKPLNDLRELEDAVQQCVRHARHWERKLRELIDLKPAPKAPAARSDD